MRAHAFGRALLATIASVSMLIAPALAPAQFAIPGWSCYAGNPLHWALSFATTNPMDKIVWHTPVDTNPVYSGNDLLTHYGSPLITPLGTLVLPVKTPNAFLVQGRSSATGVLLWQVKSNYQLPPHNWTPECGISLGRNSFSHLYGQMVYIPMSGGRIMVRYADSKYASSQILTYYGPAAYNANPSAYDSTTYINTPITVGPDGTAYFGVVVTGANPSQLKSGLVIIQPNFNVGFIDPTISTGDSSMKELKMNGAPALTADGKDLYYVVSSGANGHGYLCRTDTTTIAFATNVVPLMDPQSGQTSVIDDDGTASPMIGTDGDVYVGVLENPFGGHHLRGWMLHFKGDLSASKTPGSFGWDDTPSIIVPTNLVTASPYFLLTKYNNYAGGGGDGVNKVAILDPRTTEVDPISGVTVMNEVETLTGPTPDTYYRNNGFPNAVREWCINSAAIDAVSDPFSPLGFDEYAFCNSEDGTLYQWDLINNVIKAHIVLTAGIGEAYTPTLIAPDGRIFAISNAVLYCIGSGPDIGPSPFLKP